MRRWLPRLRSTVSQLRCFTVGVQSSAVPRGMQMFELRDSAATIEEIAEAYIHMDLPTMKTFHELVVKSVARPAGAAVPSYEDMLLQGLSSGCAAPVASTTLPGAQLSTAESTSVSTGKGPAANKATEKAAFDVMLRKYPAQNKVKLIKELRAVSNLPLQEAKVAVEKCPGILVKAMPKADAEKLKALLVAHEAEVELL